MDEVSPMSLRYTNIRRSPKVFFRLFGVSVSDFSRILGSLEKLWESEVIGRYKRPGRPFSLCLADMVLMVLLYYRSYTTQIFISYLFNLDASNVCRIIKLLEPLLVQVVALPEAKSLSQEEIETILLDATEQAIERPKHDQKPYYSGKKKHHTLKIEIRITETGKIIFVSGSCPGATHDYALYKTQPPLDARSRCYADSGYQGIQELHPNAEIPYKKSKNKPLTEEEKEYNTALARIRVPVEHAIGKMKRFRILSDKYRKKRKRYDEKVKIIAGITNLKNGFKAA